MLKEKIFTYSLSAEAWQEIPEMPSLNREHWSLILYDTDKKVLHWCHKHQQFETLQTVSCSPKDNTILCDKSLKIKGFRKVSPVAIWHIIANSEALTMTIKLTIAKISWQSCFRWCNMKNITYPDMKWQEKIYIYPLDVTVRDFTPIDYKIPPIVIYNFSCLWAELVKIKYNHLPAVPTAVDLDNEFLQQVILRPFDMHINILKSFIGRDFYWLFRRENTNNFAMLCDYLRIQPHKSIRKLYLANPYYLIFYRVLLKLGFKDINAIRLFLIPDILNKIDFSNCYYDRSLDRIYKFHMPLGGIDLIFFLRWQFERQKNEMTIAKQLSTALLYSQEITNTHYYNYNIWARREDTLYRYDTTMFNDLLRLFHENFPMLQPEVLQIIQQRGLSLASHDALAMAIRHQHFTPVAIKYTDKILTYDQEILDFKFRVVTNTMELPKIGSALSNCVAGYAKKVINGRCLIVTVTQDDKYVGCIELVPENNQRININSSEPQTTDMLSVNQALGKFNARLTGTLLEAVCLWVEMCHFTVRCNHLNQAREE